jgi:hypothetical protein
MSQLGLLFEPLESQTSYNFREKVFITYISFVLYVLHFTDDWYVSSYEFFVELKTIRYIIFVLILFLSFR